MCPSIFHSDFSDRSRQNPLKDFQEQFFYWKGFLLHRKLKIRLSLKERFYFWTEDMTSIFHLFDLKFVKVYFGGKRKMVQSGGRRGKWCNEVTFLCQYSHRFRSGAIFLFSVFQLQISFQGKKITQQRMVKHIYHMIARTFFSPQKRQFSILRQRLQATFK